jgi:hypothetical protein
VTITQLHEAKAMDASQLTGKTWRIKIIEGNKKGSSAFYPAAAVEAGAPLFAKGTRIYADHPSSDEKWSRPERSIRDIIGVFETDAEYEGTDLYTNATFFTKFQEEIKEMAEAGVIGMSIRASGEVEETADGPVLKAFTSVQSVDVVTTAGAGGGFDKLLESKREETVEPKESVMDEAMKAALDALVESGKQTAEAVGKLAEAEAKRQADAAAALEEANKPKELSATEVAAALVEAKLTSKAQARVLAAVDAGTELAEAITAEKELAAEILAEAKNANEPNLNGNVLEEGGKTVSISSNVFGD